MVFRWYNRRNINLEGYKFITYNGRLYFIGGANEPQNDSDGMELWETDGTTEGTFNTRPNFATTPSSLAGTHDLIVFNNALFFGAYFTNQAKEFYKLTSTAINVNEYANQLFFNIYPNPTKDLLNIEVEKESQFLIFDITGNEVKFFNANSGKNTIDISNLSSGMYFIQEVSTGSQMKMIKL